MFPCVLFCFFVMYVSLGTGEPWQFCQSVLYKTWVNETVCVRVAFNVDTKVLSLSLGKSHGDQLTVDQILDLENLSCDIHLCYAPLPGVDFCADVRHMTVGLTSLLLDGCVHLKSKAWGFAILDKDMGCFTLP